MSEIHYESPGISAELSDDYHHTAMPFMVSLSDSEYYTYLNAATCPDCGGAMARLGGCHSCPSCGFATCQV